jgi:hypothetical protein
MARAPGPMPAMPPMPDSGLAPAAPVWYYPLGITSGPARAGLGNLGRTPKVPSRVEVGNRLPTRGCGRGSDNQVSGSRRCQGPVLVMSGEAGFLLRATHRRPAGP